VLIPASALKVPLSLITWHAGNSDIFTLKGRCPKGLGRAFACLLGWESGDRECDKKSTSRWWDIRRESIPAG
jgi:hypothetical protein